MECNFCSGAGDGAPGLRSGVGCPVRPGGGRVRSDLGGRLVLMSLCHPIWCRRRHYLRTPDASASRMVCSRVVHRRSSRSAGGIFSFSSALTPQEAEHTE